jgi:hypothetical protein
MDHGLLHDARRDKSMDMRVVIEPIAVGMNTVCVARASVGDAQGFDEVDTYHPVCALDHALEQFAVPSKPGPQYLRDRKGDMQMRNRLDQFTDLLAEQDRALRGVARTGSSLAAGEGHEIVTATRRRKHGPHRFQGSRSPGRRRLPASPPFSESRMRMASRCASASRSGRSSFSPKKTSWGVRPFRAWWGMTVLCCST